MKTTTTLFALFLGLTLPVCATHMMGGDLTYKCISNLEYEVTLSFYRDCTGINAPADAGIRAYSNGLGVYEDYTLSLIHTELVSAGCSSWLTTCEFGPHPGAEVHVYRDTITLVGASDEWIIFYEECCRNPSITNLVQPSSNGAFLNVQLNNQDFPCNNSPVFMEKPNYVICQDQYFCLNNTAYDPDGDSLVYEMVEAMASIGTPMYYQPGYSATNPIPSSSGISFDGMTGNLCITPDTYGVFVIDFKVSEYRNGILVGTSMRDIQVAVGGCTTGVIHDINGTVSDTLGVPVSSGDVELYEYDQNIGAMSLIQAQPVGLGGVYSFTALPQAQYLVRAVPDTLNYPNTASTYAESTFYWSYSDVQWAHCDSTFVSDIQLVGYGNLLGTGHLSGYLGELGVRSTVGDPFTNVDIHLVSMENGVMVANTRTNSNGYWNLSNIPLGEYKVVVDVPGLSMIEHHYVSVSKGNEEHTDLDYVAELIGIRISSITTHIDSSELDGLLSVHPNPTSGVLFLNIGETELQEATIALLDLSGRTVAYWSPGRVIGQMQLDMLELTEGTYLLRIDSDKGTATRKVNVLK